MDKIMNMIQGKPPPPENSLQAVLRQVDDATTLSWKHVRLFLAVSSCYARCTAALRSVYLFRFAESHGLRRLLRHWHGAQYSGALNDTACLHAEA